jgi:hypothetical protein
VNEEREVRGHLENTGTPGRLTVCAFHGTRAHGEERWEERRGVCALQEFTWNIGTVRAFH